MIVFLIFFDTLTFKSYLKTADSLFNFKNYSLSILYYRKALEIDSTSPIAHNNLGLAYKEKKYLSLAEKEFKKAIKFAPLFYKAYINLGNLYFERKRFSDAESCYKMAERLKPNFPDLHWNFALFYEAKGDTMLAVRHWRKYIYLKREDFDASVKFAEDRIKKLLKK